MESLVTESLVMPHAPERTELPAPIKAPAAAMARRVRFPCRPLFTRLHLPTSRLFPFPCHNITIPQMVFGVPPIVTFAVLVPYELRNFNPKGGVYITPQTAFTM